MSNVNNVSNNTPVQKIAAPVIAKPASAATASAPLRASDRLELSGLSGVLKTLKANDVRTDKVADIKAQINAGTYENDSKLNAATDRLLDDLLK